MLAPKLPKNTARDHHLTTAFHRCTCFLDCLHASQKRIFQNSLRLKSSLKFFLLSISLEQKELLESELTQIDSEPSRVQELRRVFNSFPNLPKSELVEHLQVTSLVDYI